MSLNGWTPLHLAARHGHLDVCRLLLDRGASAAAAGTGNWTVLHNAAYQGHLQIVELLLARGARPAERDSSGKTAAEHAAERGHPSAASVLRVAAKLGNDDGATSAAPA